MGQPWTEHAGWFKPPGGDQGFVYGKYVIFHDTENPYAEQARANILSSTAYETQHQELTNLLVRLAQAERAKEINYILNKLILLPEDSDIKSQITSLLNSNDKGRLSAVINVLVKRKEELEELVKDYGALDRGAMKSGGVYGRKFGDYLADELKKTFVQGERDGGWIGNDALSQDVDSLIHRFLKEKVFNNTEINKRWKMYKELYNRLRKSFATQAPKGWYNEASDLFEPINEELLKTTITNTGTKGNTIRQQIDNLILAVLAGIPLEYKIGGEFIAGNLHVDVQNVRNTGILEGKEDVGIMDKATAEISFNEGIDEDLLEKIMTDMKMEVEQLENAIGPNGWLISISAKDYGSNQNIHIGDGKLINLEPRIKRVAAAVGESSEVVDRIIFNLNNALEDGDVNQALESLALICVAWMFDDVEQMFRASSQDGTLHVYNINGYYMLLSDLLLDASESIQSINITNLVKVDFTGWPGAHNLWETERYNYWSRFREQHTNQPTAPIWEEVKDNMMNQSTANIKFKYSTIASFSNSLRELLRNSLKDT